MRAVLSLLLVVLAGCAPSTPPHSAVGLNSATTGLRFLQGGGGDDAFARAASPREFRFPEDHGNHPEFRSEWWYLTGNVADAKGARFGFQATFFRFALAAAEPNRAGSDWRATRAWMAHIAVTDEAAGQFIARERLARDALAISGAGLPVGTVRVEDWELRATHRGHSVEWSVDAQDEGVGLSVVAVGESESAVAQGDRGLDRKGSEPGNASFYYSMPRLGVTGNVRIGTREVAVTGTAWLDREWGTSALSQDVEGWDWFALQFEDASTLMYYRLRRADGAASEFSSGKWIGAAGETERLLADDVILRPRTWWQSPATLARYPIEWELEVPSRHLMLRLTALVPQQELNLTVRYWEGAVEARGTRDGADTLGRGYVELTGYGAGH